jgi:hypothetical protein
MLRGYNRRHGLIGLSGSSGSRGRRRCRLVRLESGFHRWHGSRLAIPWSLDIGPSDGDDYRLDDHLGLVDDLGLPSVRLGPSKGAHDQGGSDDD